MIDSATPRGFGPTCNDGPPRRTMWSSRPTDAYAGLQFLQEQAFVQPDRVALMGWSQGGGVGAAVDQRQEHQPAVVQQ